MKPKLVSSLFFMLLVAFISWLSLGLQPSVAATSAGECSIECFLYMPFLVKPENIDFTATDIEIFQAIQTDANSVPLVAGKPAVARIYAQLLDGVSPNDVKVSLTAVRNGSTLGTVNATGPATVPASPSHGAYNSTYNVVLPGGWLSGQVQLTAKVDSTNSYGETNESNNQFSRVVTFNSVPNLQIKIVPINYTHQGGSDPGLYPAQSVDYISNWIRRTYPIGNTEISIRSPYNFTGDLEIENPNSSQNIQDAAENWQQLLWEMYLLKTQTDGRPEQTPIVYYAFVPTENGANQWFFGGIAGIGWISPPGQNFRESVGLNLGQNDDTGILAGHEVGHNLGRQHAPCGGAAGADPSYPYSGASIGQYGTDIQGNSVAFYTPASHVDLMSYCAPEWISDYTYIALYNNQRTQGLLQVPNQTADHLVMHASFSDNGLNLSPIYALSTKGGASVSASNVMVELLDSNGVIIATHQVAVREAVEEGIHLRSILGSVPLPATPVAAIRLVEGTAVLAERQLIDPERVAQASLAISQTPEAVTLNWGLPDVPVIIRYTANDGENGDVLAVDVWGGSYTVPTTELTADGRFEIILANTSTPTILTADFTMP